MSTLKLVALRYVKRVAPPKMGEKDQTKQGAETGRRRWKKWVEEREGNQRY